MARIIRHGQMMTDVDYAAFLDQAIRRIKKYKGDGGGFEKVKTQEDLTRYIKKNTGVNNEGLSRAIFSFPTKTKDEIKDNKEVAEIEKEAPKKIRKTAQITNSRAFAKKNKLIYRGKNKRGQTYYYDYKKKKFTKKPFKNL